jgi:HEAT repeat protein
MTTIAEFRSLIATAIPVIVDLLNDSKDTVRAACTGALSTLSEHGKIPNLWSLTLLTTIIAEFRSLIVPAIPGIVTLLKDDQWDVSQAAANALLKLSGQGEKSHSLCRNFTHNNRS